LLRSQAADIPAIPVPITAIFSGSDVVTESNGIFVALFCFISGINLDYAAERRADQCRERQAKPVALTFLIFIPPRSTTGL
jgi:hypothetical protein